MTREKVSYIHKKVIKTKRKKNLFFKYLFALLTDVLVSSREELIYFVQSKLMLTINNYYYREYLRQHHPTQRQLQPVKGTKVNKSNKLSAEASENSGGDKNTDRV